MRLINGGSDWMIAKERLQITNKELCRLEEVASQINAFYFYQSSQCMKANLEEFNQKAKEVVDKKSHELFQEFIQHSISLFDKHLGLQSWMKEAVYEFQYWSSRNSSIANIIFEYVGILGGIFKAVIEVSPPDKPYSSYFEKLENRIDKLKNLLCSPELEIKLEHLSDKLYGIYYAGNILNKDISYADRTEKEYEKYYPAEKNSEDGILGNAGVETNKTSPDSKIQDEPLIFLQKREILTLEVLNEARPEILTLDKIAEYAKRSKQTVFVALKKLYEYGFVAQNERGNYIITEAGIGYFSKHFC